MILQALKDYYDRKAADPEGGMAPEGWEYKAIPFVVVLDEQGKLVQIEDTREGDGPKKKGKVFLIPQAVKKTSGIAANLLWDVAGYVFGTYNMDSLTAAKRLKAEERALRQKAAFLERVKEELPEGPRKVALHEFLENVTPKRLEKEPAWKEVYDANALLTFRFAGDLELFCRTRDVADSVGGGGPVDTDQFCMLTGDQDETAKLHTAIKGVRGAQSSGANIVSFNLDAFRSFGKDQGGNAPVGNRAMFAYTTALNSLLAKESNQRMQIGDATTVFWSERKTSFESDFGYFFREPDKDDPAANTYRIKDLFSAPQTGAYREDSGEEKFYVLGLAPNAARIAVRFWKVGTVSEFAERIRQHFEDLAIVKPPNEPEYYSLWRLMVNVATLDKSDNIPPNLAGSFMRSILDGTPYPASLLQAALRRIRSDTEYRVKPVRAALLKAYLNRYTRAHSQEDRGKEIAMALKIDHPSLGYQLGRLFAVLEKIQEEANPGLNATIRERYYGAACSSPVTVFANLLRLKNHHLAKLDNKGRVVNLERLVGEIMGRFRDFPAHLDLHEQGTFAIGYYHQRQSFFEKKSGANSQEGENSGSEEKV